MNSSPFSKEEIQFQRELSSFEKLQESIVEVVNETFVDSLPSDDIKQLPPSFMYPIGICLFATLTAIYVALFTTGFQSEMSQTFLSPLNGYIADKNCKTVSLSNTGTFMATESGSWEGQINFEYSFASYAVTMTSYSLSYAQYQQLMNQVYYVFLVPTAAISKTQDLALNLINWMSLAFVPESTNNAQRFYFTGTPLTVFDRQKTAGAISNVFGDCNASSLSSFDPGSGLLVLNYNYNEYMANPLCNSIVDPVLFGYVPEVDGDTFTVELDVRTLATGVAMNLGVLQVTSLVEIIVFRDTIAFDGVVYNVSSYYDPKYPGMTPLTCIINATDIYAYQCVAKVNGLVYAIPVFNHAGNNFDQPETCDCATVPQSELDDPQSNCNLFNLLSGFMFWPTQYPDAVFEVAKKYNNNLKSLNAAAFNASYVASYWGKVSPDRQAVLNTPAYRSAAYEFCNVTTYGPCSLVTFSSFDNFQVSWAVSQYYYQLQRGACANTFVGTKAEWSKLVTVPFATLTQAYEQCTNDPFTVFINQAGSSVGNVSLLTPLCVVFLMGLLVMYANFFRISIPKSYSKSDKDRALNTFAISLLLARDNALKTSENKRQMESLLKKLVAELSENAELTENQFKQEAMDEGGLNWAYIGDKVSQLNPLHKKKGTVSSSNSSEKNERDRRQREASSEDHSIELVESGNAPLTVCLSPGPAAITTTTSAGSAVAQIIADPRLVVLNKSTSVAATRIESTSSEDGAGDRAVEVSAALDLLEDFVARFRDISENSGDGSSSPAYWIVASKTSSLRRLKVDFSDNKSKERQFYALLEVLMVLHASISLSCSESTVRAKHSDTVAYAINDEVLLLSEVSRRITGE